MVAGVTSADVAVEKEKRPVNEAIAPPATRAIDPVSPARLINRELSWLAFNERVLEEATNANHPLLERLRFLSISSSNLDEFYMVRVAGLKGQVAAKVEAQSPEGMTPAQQLAAIHERAGALLKQQTHTWRDLKKKLRKAGIPVVDPKELPDEDLSLIHI